MADDYAISKNDFDALRDASKAVGLGAGELVLRMERRARQNVIYEIGYLNAKIGPGRCYILTDDGVTPPSNTVDAFRTKISSINLAETLEEFLFGKLGLIRDDNPLLDRARRIEYGNLVEELENLDDVEILNDFDVEFSELGNDDDRLVYIYERIVFDSYFQQPGWWRKLISRIQSRGKPYRDLVLGLNLVQDYIANWRPPERTDFSTINLVVDELRSLLSRIEAYGVAPIVGIVLNDYLGLALDKRARQLIEQKNSQEAVVAWTEAVAALDRVIDLADEFEAEDLPLWRGYALYNKARVLRQISDHDAVLGDGWMLVFQKALRCRYKWTQTPVFLPNMVKMGLFAEYLHATVTRILVRRPDEAGEYAITDEFVMQAKSEFDAWLAGPDQNRVRLARNVIDAWMKVNLQK